MPNFEGPPISIVIPSWKGRALLEKTLVSVRATDYPELEIIVVENGVADDTAELVQDLAKQDQRIRLLQFPRNLGYASAVNQGVQASKNRFIAVLCNDNFVKPDWLQVLVRVYREAKNKGQKVAALMSQSSCPGLDTSLRGTLNFMGRNIVFSDPRLLQEPLPIFYPGGNAFLFDREALPLPFDDFYFTYGEDVYFGWRLRNLGFEVLYCHQSFVESFDGGTTKRTPFSSAYLAERNRLLNLCLFPQAPTFFKLLPLWLIDDLFNILFGKNRLAKLGALLWMLKHPGTVFYKRKILQRERRVVDSQALSCMSVLYRSGEGVFVRFLNRWARVYLRAVGLELGKDLSS